MSYETKVQLARPLPMAECPREGMNRTRSCVTIRRKIVSPLRLALSPRRDKLRKG